MLKELIDRIRTLPPLPRTFTQMNELFSTPDPSIRDLASIIEKDPMVVANLLKVANSPLYGFQKEIKSVLQAVSLFGLSTTKALATDISVKKLLKVDMEPYSLSPDDFATICSLQSALMSEWYSKVDKSKLDILFLASLLQETGKILIADEVVKNDEVYQFKSEIQTSFNISGVEKSFVGTSTAEVTAMIFEHWKFDPKMVLAIKHSDNYTAAPEEIKEYSLALYVVKSAVPVNAPFGDRSITIAINALEREGLNPNVFADAVERVIERA